MLVLLHLSGSPKQGCGTAQARTAGILGVEAQVWSQAPTAQSGKDYVRKGRLTLFQARGPRALQRRAGERATKGNGPHEGGACCLTA